MELASYNQILTNSPTELSERQAMRELSADEIDQVSGGALPIFVALAALSYTESALVLTAFGTGVGAGWKFYNYVSSK